MDSTQRHQLQLLDQIRYTNRAAPITQTTEAAYLATPRHMFVSRYRRLGGKDWCDANANNLPDHLPSIYADGPLILSGDDDGDIASTISQPSLVLRMLDLLQIEPAQNIFELGAGSGWNAALLGHLVGPAGHVYSLEILPDMASRAAAAIQMLAIQNVTIVEADGSQGYAIGAPYDRAIFTAGTYDLPRYFFEQIKDDGLLLLVIKNQGGGDCLFLLRRRESHFESIESIQCAFVQMTGQYRIDNLEPICLEQSPEWSDLNSKELARTPFWWGGQGKESFIWRTWGIRAFLAVAEPLFHTFKTDKKSGGPFEEHYFGLWDRPGNSLVVAKDDALISYGTPAAKDRLLYDIEKWLHLGMPTTTCFTLQIFPSDIRLHAGENQWIIKRTHSQFLWTLSA